MFLGWLRHFFDGRKGAPARGPGRPATEASLPEVVTAVDVETTGLTPDDRVVSLAAVQFRPAALIVGAKSAFDFTYLIFNPGRPNHPQAERVHGYSDWLLAHQEPFAQHAETISGFLMSSDMLVAHNAAFDLAFINRELALADIPALDVRTYCTMDAYREISGGESASLAAICKRIGLARRGVRHDAMEDAWLALQLFLWLSNSSARATLPNGMERPLNLRAAPPAPKVVRVHSGATRARIEADPMGAHRLTALVETVKAAKRHEQLEYAAALLVEECDNQEREARLTGLGVAPWYYEQLAIVYRKLGLFLSEVDILERFSRQAKAPGVLPAKLLTRLDSLRRDARYGDPWA